MTELKFRTFSAL